MTLSNAFTIAWKELKTGAATVAVFLTKNTTNIQSAVSAVGTVAAVIDPPLAPIITEFDLLEEEVVGKVLELASDAANAASLGALFGSAWPVILSLKTQLSTHPAVQAAATATKAS